METINSLGKCLLRSQDKRAFCTSTFTSCAVFPVLRFYVCHTGGSVDASRGKLIHIFLGQQRQLLTSASLNLYQEVKAEIQGPNEVSLQPCVSLCTRLLHASEVTGAGGNKQQLLAIFHLLLHNFPDFNISL